MSKIKDHLIAQMTVQDEVDRIINAWPEAQAFHTFDRASAVVIIPEPASTYIVEVGPDATRSLHVPHGGDRCWMPEWQDGWVD